MLSVEVRLTPLTCNPMKEILPLYAHQKRIIDEDKKWCGLFLGTGASKTRTALELAEGSILVVCPKQQREDRTWQDNAEKFGIICNITVISKEDFRRDWDKLPRFNTVIIDEAHNNTGVSADTRQRKLVQIPKTSQIFEATYAYLDKHKPDRFYMATATPYSKPMNIWAIATLLGYKWDFFAFREKYYTQVRMGMRSIWIPRKSDELKEKLVELLKRMGYTGGLNDFFDVPEQTHKVVHIDLTKEQEEAINELNRTEADPMVRKARIRTIENGIYYGVKVEQVDEKTQKMSKHTTVYPSEKIDYILQRAIEFPKLLIFAQYTAQIKEIAKALRKEGYTVAELTGETKDRVNTIKDAEKSKAHIVVAQSTISSGYELPSFPCVIFASKSWQFLHYEQGLGRVLRSNALKKNLYIHLVVKGGSDEGCHKAIMEGADFQEKLDINY
jgi:hypothetical protein